MGSMPNTSSFPNGQLLQPSSLLLGQPLSSDSYISGKLALLWSLNPTDDHFRFCISAKYPLNTSDSDYITAQSKGLEKWRFVFHVAPSTTGLKPGQTARQALEAEHKEMEVVVGLDVKIALDGLKVIKLHGKELELEGTGSRMMWTEKRGKWIVFQETTPSSIAPSWLEFDSNLPLSIASFARTAQQGGPSNLRPISSHLPPQLNLRPTNSPTKRKRTASPEKQSLAPAAKQTAPVVFKRTIDLAPGKHAAFTRLTSGFNDPAILRGSSSIGDALGGSSSSSLDTAPQHPQVSGDSSVTETSRQPRPTPVETAPPAQQNTVLEPASQMPPVRQRQPVTAADKRAEAEAAARLKGAQRLEEEKARQRADQEAAAVLARGLDAGGVIHTPLNHLREGPSYNVIGVVVDVKPINLPSGKRADPLLAVIITDPSIYKAAVSDAEDTVVTIFRKHASDLPSGLRRGTPIVFRGMKTLKFKDKIKGNLYSGCGGWATMVDNKPLYGAGGHNFTLHRAEADRLAELKQWWEKTTGETQDPSGATQLGNLGPSRSAKTALLGEVGKSNFFDAAFKILYVHTGQQMAFELYATDGSVSPHTPRNFHNVSYDDLPSNAIFCINIPDKPFPHEEEYFKAGNIMRLENLRRKMYKGELEISWSNLMTEEQAHRSFKDKRPILLAKDDPRSVELERRLAALQKATRSGGRQPSPQKTYDDESQYIRSRPEIKLSSSTIDRLAPTASIPDPSVAQTSSDILPTATLAAPANPDDVSTATHIHTIFKDPIDHQTRTLAEVMSNCTFPNKFRVRARVKEIRPRGISGNASFVQKHCGHCRKAISSKTVHCQSCQDVHMKNASWQYRFVAILEDENTILPILISDYEAERFLPSLPPISASTNPNDQKQADRRILGICQNVIQTLQGATMDGIRSRPWIDWTIQSVVVPAPKGHVGLKGEKGVLVYKAFGMVTN